MPRRGVQERAPHQLRQEQDISQSAVSVQGGGRAEVEGACGSGERVTRYGCSRKALVVFDAMDCRHGVMPDDVWCHGLLEQAYMPLITMFLDSDGVASSLITMYSKCGSLGDALQQFEIAEDCLCVMS